MAETKDTKGKKDAGAEALQTGTQSRTLSVRLVPANNSEQPVVSNYVSINLSPGMAFIDFGFLEPAVLAALPQVAKRGGKLPESINGRLAVRVVMGYESLANLHQQLGRVLASQRVT